MRIVHVVDYYQPTMGYQEYYLATRQAAAGNEVHVVTSDRYMPWKNYDEVMAPRLGPRIVGAGMSESDGVTVHRLPVRFEFRRNAVWISGLRECLDRLHPDVVSVDGVFTLTAGRLARMNRGLQLPLVFDSHVADYNSGSASLRFRLSRAAFRGLLVRAIREEADALIAIDPGTRDVLCRELGVNQVPIIFLGADERLFRPDPDARARGRALLDAGAETVIGYAGKLYPSKNLQLLIRAARRLEERGETAHRLVIVGRGSAEHVRWLRGEAAPLGDRVMFVERMLDHGELNDFFNAVDVAVWPSEPSNGIQEGMAAGAVIVLPHVNAQGHSNEHYVRRDNGALFQRDDVESLADCLSVLVADRDRRHAMSARARAYIEEDLSWTRIAEQFTEAFAAAIEHRRRRAVR